MSKYLFDISSVLGKVRLTLKLAVYLHESGNEVFYTHASDSGFTLTLIKQGIGRIIFPEDLLWFSFDRVLLDIHLRCNLPIYKKHQLQVILVDIEGLGEERKLIDNIPVLSLPPSEYSIPTTSLRNLWLHALLKKRTAQQIVIADMLRHDIGVELLTKIYRMIKESCERNTQYRCVLLTRNDKLVQQLFSLPENLLLFRWLDAAHFLPSCDVMLTNGELNTLIESVYTNVPAVVYSIEDDVDYDYAMRYLDLGLGERGDMNVFTSERFDSQITGLLHHQALMKERLTKLRKHYQVQNAQIEQTVLKLKRD
jgi:hypothetical protein